eukprot:COSAG02_NODE_68800_length_220_cov_11.099174_1_plen_36_part_10
MYMWVVAGPSYQVSVHSRVAGRGRQRRRRAAARAAA